MITLLGPKGEPISSAQFQNKKASPPATGEAFGAWAGRDIEYMQLPGGGLVQFDLSKLTVEDFRVMKDHYQVNASLAVLSFMQHQSDFHIECEDQKIADLCEEQIRDQWTMLNRHMSQANWAGYSPGVLQWENDMNSRTIVLDKIKDLIPEECAVNWKKVDGWAPPNRTPPKFNVYDGIKQIGQPWPIPVDNSFWYPLLMENGDYYGRKLLRPAFQSWYFSILVHLFANRYYERFGEPVPIGRAPFEDELDVDGKPIRGNQYMLKVLADLRSRSVVVLPDDKTDMGSGKVAYDYEIEYLESQMRGADFERYLTRLDEEISIGLFTPILLLRTADVGSYNLGVGHTQMYLWMMNAMNADRAQYINRYILSRITDFNFSPKAPRPKIVFRKLGNTNGEMVSQLLQALIQNGKAMPDIDELGQIAGLTIKEIRETTAPPPEPGQDDPQEGDGDEEEGDSTEARAIAKEIITRVAGQVESAYRNGTFGDGLRINMGFKRRFERALEAAGVPNASRRTDGLYGRMDNWLHSVVALGPNEFSGPESFMGLFARVLNAEVSEACHVR